MITQYFSENQIQTAAQLIRDGRLVAFPTETVFGLGVDATNQLAVESAFKAKGRPSDNPLIAHVSDESMLLACVESVSESALRLIEVFSPGPLTLVLPRSPLVCDAVSAGLPTVAVRIPGNEIARKLIRLAGVPIAAPSANTSGRPSSTTWQAVREDLDGKIDGIVESAPSVIGLESTVVEVNGDEVVVLRHGAITVEQLREHCEKVRPIERSQTFIANSPGLRHKHYQPKARVFLLPANSCEEESVHPQEEVNTKTAWIGLSEPQWARSIELTKQCDGVKAYAACLYEFFRECDRRGVSAIYCDSVGPTGIGIALMDRLTRASES